MLHIIVAVAKNQAIGKDNQLLWHLRDDLKRFQKITTGHSIIMGRKTFESLPGMLPGRAHWVLTRDRDWAAAHPEVRCFASVAEVLQALRLFTVRGATAHHRGGQRTGGGHIFPRDRRNRLEKNACRRRRSQCQKSVGASFRDLRSSRMKKDRNAVFFICLFYVAIYKVRTALAK